MHIHNDTCVCILDYSKKPLNMAEIATEFILRFNYLPTLERRLRELVNSHQVLKNGEKIPTFTLARPQLSKTFVTVVEKQAKLL